ncbi:hypothetical protein ES703_85812 [subsurface metagenome]
MSRQLKWTIEDNVVALYLAMYSDRELQYKIRRIEDIISKTLFVKKGFKMRIKNYLYIVTSGKEGLDARYPDGFPLYKELYDIFKSFDPDKFRDYVNMILEKRKDMGKCSE